MNDCTKCNDVLSCNLSKVVDQDIKSRDIITTNHRKAVGSKVNHSRKFVNFVFLRKTIMAT